MIIFTNHVTEAKKVLRELLLKSRYGKSPCAMNEKPFKYADFLRKLRRDSIRESATRLLNSSDVPHHIQTAVKNRVFFIRADCNVHSDLNRSGLIRSFKANCNRCWPRSITFALFIAYFTVLLYC
ncbi:hypothetical protein DICVIV_14175 [Dictyocaulus viviparus]|uniref:Uncharacterized protein n=1 Tax=Dictyocaulus viviparus TaxID=29172 RepID=A0A0D8X5V8_DICVI|nr:hypothetical protein DICVIV_14175 [Dictyocaulus viviparus]